MNKSIWDFSWQMRNRAKVSAPVTRLRSMTKPTKAGPGRDLTIGEAFDLVAAILARVNHDSVTLVDDADRLSLVGQGLQVSDQLAATVLDQIHRLDRDDIAPRHTGASTATWLSQAHNLTARRARGLVKQGQDLAAVPAIGTATLTGEVSLAQAVAITRTLAELPAGLTTQQHEASEATMLAYCQEFDATHLSKLSEKLLEVIAPDTAEELEGERLERQDARAGRERYLQFTDDGHGTTIIRGSLPTMQARIVETVLGTFAEQAHRRGIEHLDPFLALSTRPQRLADALVTTAERVQHCNDAPSHGGDRPRLVVTIAHDRLLEWNQPEGGREVGSGQRLTPTELRRIACDADILPVVLGGDSEILDVGTTRRLVTSAIRVALTVRDKGCAFPGCDKLPVDCEAHHLTPWQQGGPTSLTNLVLLCRHHHAMIEPSRYRGVDKQRWTIELSSQTGLPQARPPAMVDPQRRPRQHQRFRLRQ